MFSFPFPFQANKRMNEHGSNGRAIFLGGVVASSWDNCTVLYQRASLATGFFFPLFRCVYVTGSAGEGKRRHERLYDMNESLDYTNHHLFLYMPLFFGWREM